MNMRTENKEKTEYVLFILDESGSMESCKPETISGFNEQIQELKKTKAIKTYVSLVKFSGSVQTLYWNKPLEEVEELTKETYLPSGSTSMLDAVGQSISKLKNEVSAKNDDVTFLVIIVSDGAENTSREYTWDSVRQIITKCKEDKCWTITYMGSNQDLSEVRAGLNLDAGNTMTYTSTGTGTQFAFTNMTRSLANYRSLRADNTAAGLAVSGVMASFYVDPSNGSITNGIIPPNGTIIS